MDFHCCKCGEPIGSEAPWYGLHKNCFVQWFKLREPSPFLDLAARSQSQSPQNPPEANISFFHGAYRKYSARLNGSSFIIKVQQKEYPELPVTEFLCNQIYESLNVQIPEYYLIRFPDEQFCFVTKNFMSELTASDLVHIYHYVKGLMAHDCESLIEIVGNLTGRRTEQERFAYLTLADSLIGNHDRHGRNLGFIRSPKGMILAPFYDNPSALGIEDHSMLGADLQPRGSIFTKETDKPTIKDYVSEWRRLGFQNVVDEFRKNHSLETIHQLIQDSYLSEKRKNAFTKLITQRSKELCVN